MNDQTTMNEANYRQQFLGRCHNRLDFLVGPRMEIEMKNCVLKEFVETLRDEEHK